MKKLLAFVALVLVCTASMKAQEKVKVTCNGNEVGTNEVVAFYAVENEKLGYASVKIDDPYFINTSDEDIELAVKIHINSSSALKKVFNWCGVIQSCQDITTTSVTRTTTLAPGQSVKMALDAKFAFGDYMTTNASVTVMADNEYATSFVLRYVYADPTGISQVKADNKGLQVNGSTLSYAFGSAAPRTISLYATDGRLVKRAATTAANGTVSLAGLQRGLYLATTGMGSSVKIMVK